MVMAGNSQPSTTLARTSSPAAINPSFTRSISPTVIPLPWLAMARANLVAHFIRLRPVHCLSWFEVWSDELTL